MRRAWPPNASRFSARTAGRARAGPAVARHAASARAGRRRARRSPPPRAGAPAPGARRSSSAASSSSRSRELVGVDLVELLGRVDVAQLLGQAVHAAQPAELRQGALQRQLVCPGTAAAGPARPAAAGRASRRAGRGPSAAGRRAAARPSSSELRALLRRSATHQRLHRGHPLGQLLDDVVERPGAREERAVARQEAVDIVLEARRRPAAPAAAGRGRAPSPGSRRAARAWRRGSPRDMPSKCASSTWPRSRSSSSSKRSPRVGLEEVVVGQAADALAEVRRAAPRAAPGGARRGRRPAAERRRVAARSPEVRRRSIPRRSGGHDRVELCADVAQDVVQR